MKKANLHGAFSPAFWSEMLRFFVKCTKFENASVNEPLRVHYDLANMGIIRGLYLTLKGKCKHAFKSLTPKVFYPALPMSN